MEIIWSKLLGSGPFSPDEAYGVTVSADGNAYIVGVTSGSLGGKPNAGITDAFVAKMADDGGISWLQMLGTPAYEEARAIAIDASGHIFVAGHTSGNLAGQINAGAVVNANDFGYDVFIAKYNQAGERDWLKLLGSSSYWDQASAIVTAPDGSVYAAGDTGGDLGGQINAGGSDAFIAKYNSKGEQEWVRLIGSSSSDWATALVTGADGSIYVAGWTGGNLQGQAIVGGNAAFVSKLSPSGTLDWTSLLDAGAAGYVNASSLSVGSDGAIYMAGKVSAASLAGQSLSGGSDVFVAKLSQKGNLEDLQLFGTDKLDSANAIATGPGGEIYVVGRTDGDLGGEKNAGEGDAFIIKLSSGSRDSALGPSQPIEESVISAIVAPGILASAPIYLEGLRELREPAPGRAGEYSSWLVEYADLSLSYPTIAQAVMIATRNGDFTPEFRQEIREVPGLDSYVNLPYGQIVELVGQLGLTIDQAILAVAGADRNFVG